MPSTQLALLPIEYGSWLLPGFVYALTPAVLHRLHVSPSPKGLFNLIDPVVVAILCSLAFLGLAFGVRRPRNNQAAAYATIAAHTAIAVAILLYMPPLPQ